MKLEVNGSVTDSPHADDIRRAIAGRNTKDDLSLSLTLDEQHSIDADWLGDARFLVTYAENGRFADADRELDDTEVTDLLVKYLARDERWRNVTTWTPWPDPSSNGATPAASSGAGFERLPVLLWIGVALVAMWFVPQMIDEFVRIFAQVRLPRWLDSTVARIMLGFFVAIVLLMLVATIVKVREVRAAAKWPKTTGRIIRSQAGFNLVQRRQEDMPTNERIADILYEYQVDGRTYRASRFTMAEKVGADEIPGILARYPEGKTVDVFYDPAKPGDATLDRDMSGLAKGCLSVLAIGIAFVVGAMALVTLAPDVIQRGLPNAIVPLVAIFGLGALIMLRVGWVFARGTLQSRSWPKTAGRVTLSTVHEFETIDRDTSGSSSYRRTIRRRAHMPVVEYEYGVAGRTFKSRHIKLDTEVAGSEAYATAIAAKYPAGKIVMVRYDPKDPQRAYIEASYGWGWFMLGLGVLLLVAAAWAAGLLTEGPPLKMKR